MKLQMAKWTKNNIKLQFICFQAFIFSALFMHTGEYLIGNRQLLSVRLKTSQSDQNVTFIFSREYWIVSKNVFFIENNQCLAPWKRSLKSLFWFQR